IADHAAAERHHHVVAANSRGDDRLAQLHEGLVRLRCFARPDSDRRGHYAGRGEACVKLSAIERGRIRVGDDGGPLGASRGGDSWAGYIDKSRSYQNVVGARAKLDWHADEVVGARRSGDAIAWGPVVHSTTLGRAARRRCAARAVKSVTTTSSCG